MQPVLTGESMPRRNTADRHQVDTREPVRQVASTPGSPAPAESEASTIVTRNGRRYRLVAIDDEPAADASAPQRGLASAADLLTERELQIAALVAHGFVNKEIAARLRISEWTVSTHLRRIFAKLGVDRRAAMVSRCADVLLHVR